MMLQDYPVVSIAWIVMGATTLGVNSLPRRPEWGWKFIIGFFCFVGLVNLVADSGILTIIPHTLIRLHLMHRQYS